MSETTEAPQSLHAWRESRGLSQRELARQARVSQGMISLIEAGKHSPRVEIAQRIAQALGVATDDIAWGQVSDARSGGSGRHGV